MLDGRDDCVCSSSFVYNRERVYTNLTARQLGVSLELMICSKRILVLRLPYSPGLDILQKKVIFRVTLVYALLGLGIYAGPAL